MERTVLQRLWQSSNPNELIISRVYYHTTAKIHPPQQKTQKLRVKFHANFISFISEGSDSNTRTPPPCLPATWPGVLLAAPQALTLPAPAMAQFRGKAWRLKPWNTRLRLAMPIMWSPKLAGEADMLLLRTLEGWGCHGFAPFYRLLPVLVVPFFAVVVVSLRLPCTTPHKGLYLRRFSLKRVLIPPPCVRKWHWISEKLGAPRKTSWA